MKKTGLLARTAAGALGGVLLLGAAGAAIADELGDDDVQVSVDIAALPPVGALTMSVAADTTQLAEVASADPELRQFTGVTPTVTVTDDREEVPDGVFWYVVGQSSAFTAAGVPEIGPEHLGWTPHLHTSNNGEVAEGPDVGTIFDDTPNNVGLEGQELLSLALDSVGARATGEWQASADLTLKTPRDVEAGSYSATLTLSLWEDAL